MSPTKMYVPASHTKHIQFLSNDCRSSSFSIAVRVPSLQVLPENLNRRPHHHKSTLNGSKRGMTATMTVLRCLLLRILACASCAIPRMTISSVEESILNGYGGSMKDSILHQNGLHMRGRGGGCLKMQERTMMTRTRTFQWLTRMVRAYCLRNRLRTCLGLPAR